MLASSPVSMLNHIAARRGKNFRIGPVRSCSNRARPGANVVRQKARMLLGDMQHDRPGLEQSKVAFLIGRDLTERMEGQMRGLLQCLERHKANRVGLAHFLESPTNARIT